jgi:hypothetical protein
MPPRKRKLVTEWLETSVRSTHYPEILFNLSREDFYRKIIGSKHATSRNRSNAEKAVDEVFHVQLKILSEHQTRKQS